MRVFLHMHVSQYSGGFPTSQQMAHACLIAEESSYFKGKEKWECGLCLLWNFWGWTFYPTESTLTLNWENHASSLYNIMDSRKNITKRLKEPQKTANVHCAWKVSRKAKMHHWASGCGTFSEKPTCDWIRVDNNEIYITNRFHVQLRWPRAEIHYTWPVNAPRTLFAAWRRCLMLVGG